jgi:hypothetical protein
MPKLSTLSDNALEKLYQKENAKRSAIGNEMINTGRGYERPSETREKTDDLSDLVNAASDRCRACVDEIRGRAKYGSAYYRKNISNVEL